MSLQFKGSSSPASNVPHNNWLVKTSWKQQTSTGIPTQATYTTLKKKKKKSFTITGLFYTQKLLWIFYYQCFHSCCNLFLLWVLHSLHYKWILCMFLKKANFFNKSKLFKMAENQTGLNRDLSSNFCWLRSGSHVKSKEKYLICTEKNVLVKIFTNGLNMGFPLQIQVKKTRVETYPPSSKVLIAAIIKEGHANMKSHHSRTVNSASFCQLLRQYFTLFIEGLKVKPFGLS